MSELPPLLGPFPVDEETLDLLEAALDTTVDIDDEGRRSLIGGEFTLNTLLDLYSGTDHDTDSMQFEGFIDGIPVYSSEIPAYCPTDVIRSLLAEVRRLRAERGES